MIRLTQADLEFITSVVLHTARRLPPQFDRDDLIQQGRLAALQAALAYNPRESRGASFRTFARYRIRGAVLMSARRRHWTEAWHLPLIDASGHGDSGWTEDHIEFYTDGAPGPLEQFSQSHLWREIMDSVAAMRNPERWVFTRRQLDGVAPWRVAKQAHWPIPKVLQVETAAKLWLRDSLTAKGITPASCLT